MKLHVVIASVSEAIHYGQMFGFQWIAASLYSSQ